VYTWDGDVAGAPTLVSNAPTDVNYAFVSDNTLVTLGSGAENRIKASDQGDITQWTGSSTNAVFTDDIEGAGRLLSHAPVDDYNLIFSENQTIKFRRIQSDFIWSIEVIDQNIGIIAPMARVTVGGVPYWMGVNNFYRFRGGQVEVVPSNSQKESTILRYVFDNLNYGQKSKCFAWHNKLYNEVWFHYPSASSNECDRVARVGLNDFHWVTDTWDRTAAEYPFTETHEPRLANQGILYRHEVGDDADGSALAWSITTNLRNLSNRLTDVVSFIPDNVLSAGNRS